MQTIIQEPTYLGTLFSTGDLLAYAIWFFALLGSGFMTIYDTITKKNLLIILIVSLILPCFVLPVLNYFDYNTANTTYNTCFVNGQPKDNTKWVDGECLVKYDGYIEYSKVDKK